MKLWIARDDSQDICLHTERPRLLNGYWNSDNWFMLEKSDFPEVTFMDSPMEVELKLIQPDNKRDK